MVRNYFYLVAGLLFIFLAVTHTWFGLETALPILHGSNIDIGTITIFTFQLHMIGIQDLTYGAAAILMAFQKRMEIVKFTAWVIIAIMIARWVVMAFVTVVHNIGGLTSLLTSSMAFLVLIVLLFLGTRVKGKYNRTSSA